MRRIAVLLPSVFLLCGCGPNWDWRDEHGGVVKSVSGYFGLLLIEFDDGTTFKVPMLVDSDYWGVGQECVLQSRKSSSCSTEWRFRSPVFEPEPHAPAERENASP